jgi:hypothetical protein
MLLLMPSWEQEGFFMAGLETGALLNKHLFSSIEERYRSQTERKFTESDWIHRSYIPLYDRYHIERLRYKGQEHLIPALLNEISLNLETNLKERFKVTESNGRLIVKDGDIYSEHFPEEPLGQIILRGANVRVEKGSPEPEREGILGVLGGWLEVKKICLSENFNNATKIILFSPPGLVEHTAYTGNFIDIFEFVEEENQRYIKSTRFSVPYDYDQYAEKAVLLQPDYFDLYDGRPLDAWYLSHPIVTTHVPLPCSFTSY